MARGVEGESGGERPGTRSRLARPRLEGPRDVVGPARFALHELLRFLALMIAVSMVTFALVGMSPVDPIRANIGHAALAQLTPEKRAELVERWGTDAPIAERYARWASGAVRGDFGESLRFSEPVVDVIEERVESSLALLAIAWAISGAVGLGLGVVSGVLRGTAVDRVVLTLCHLVNATPPFWLSMVALVVFSVRLGWFPIGFSAPLGLSAEGVRWGHRLWHLVLPSLTLGVVGAPGIALHTRQKTIEVMAEGYMRFALARGESPWRAVRRHGFRNLVLPALTMQLAGIGELVGGSLLVEQVFSYPGIGQAAVVAGIGGDAPLLVGIALATSAVVYAGNLAARVLGSVVDPRVEGGRREGR